MELSRRGFLKGMAGILAAGVAPAFIGSKILMPVKKLAVPSWRDFTIVQTSASNSSLLMSIWLEDDNGRRIWTHDYTPARPLPLGATVIQVPSPTDLKLVTVGASWVEA